MKIQKYLTMATPLSRRKAELAIREGRVTVNGIVVDEPFYLVDLPSAHIALDGKKIPPPYLDEVVIIMNKPAGYLTSLHDEKERPLASDLLVKKWRQRLFPIGRLDFNSEGLLLFTNDGELAENMSHPRFQVPRTYRVKVHGNPDEKVLNRLKKGLRVPNLGFFPASQPVIERSTGKNTWIRITLKQGRNREIRKLFSYLGFQVSRLIRVAYGPLSISGLGSGQYRELTATEIAALQKFLKKQREAKPPENSRSEKPGSISQKGTKTQGERAFPKTMKDTDKPKRPPRSKTKHHEKTHRGTQKNDKNKRKSKPIRTKQGASPKSTIKK